MSRQRVCGIGIDPGVDLVEQRAIGDLSRIVLVQRRADPHRLDRVDPDPADPLPRHFEHSGASIATTVAAFKRAGGLPPLPIGEDRGFLRALRAVDAKVRHAPEVRVTVSGRLEGRAAGGMAETMARRMVLQDALLDGDLEPALICLRRATLRARTRALWARRHQADPCWREQVGVLAGCAILPSEQVASWMQSAYCGQAWARIESESPALTRVAVPRQALARQVSAAQRILAELAAQPRPAALLGFGHDPPESAQELCP